MANALRVDTTPNTRSRPPLWRWSRSQSGGSPPPKASRPEGGRPAFPSWRNRRRSLWVEIWHHGGSEGTARIRARGWEWEFPGHVTIMEVVLCLNGQPPQAN